jgi:two-component system, NarL family, response regulator NreC
MTLSIVLADDHPVVRRGMRTLLEAEPDYSVVGEAGDGLETIRLVERTQPELLVLDLMMPGLSGLDVLPIVRQRSPRTRVVVLSMYSNNAFVVTALMNGATGYVLKGSDGENLVRAVREAVAGRRFLSPPVTERAVDAYIEQARAGLIDPHETLTARERELLQLAAEGKTGGEIAASLHISQRTVENHRANVMRKLGLKNQSEVARGETYLSPAISKHVIAAYLERVGGDPSSPFERLTPRQREVLQLVAEGNTTKEIARKLHLSGKTVEMYRSQLMTALDIHNIAGLVRYAIRMGLIAPDV